MQQKLHFVDADNLNAYLDVVTGIQVDHGLPLLIHSRGSSAISAPFEAAVNELSNVDKVDSLDQKKGGLVVIFENDPALLSDLLMEYVDNHSVSIIAPITAKYYKNIPLYLIGIPKGGTHLVMSLAAALGYTARCTTPEKLKGGEWYYVEYSNAHTRAKHFFVESVYKGDFGYRNHPFNYTPVLFGYRNPADVVTSEANYYHKKGRTAFYNYFAHDDFDQRLMKLIDDPYLLGSIRDRIVDYIPWFDFGNVIPLSFEALIGHKGGGNKDVQAQLIWSVQLKLHAPGDPYALGEQVFKTDSDTFFKGQCGTYKEKFTPEHQAAFNALPQDFMHRLGYDYEQDTVYAKRIDEYRKRPLVVDIAEEWPAIIRDNQFLQHRIIEYKGQLYGLPFGTKLTAIDEMDEHNPYHIVRGRYIDEVKALLLKKEFDNLAE